MTGAGVQLEGHLQLHYRSESMLGDVQKRKHVRGDQELSADSQQIAETIKGLTNSENKGTDHRARNIVVLQMLQLFEKAVKRTQANGNS